MKQKSLAKKAISLLVAVALTTSVCVSALAAAAGSLSNFTKKNTYDGRFTDVKQSDYYYEGVKLCYETGILNGTGATTFSPEANLTEVQLTLIAARMYNIYHGGTGEIPKQETGLTVELNAGGNASWYLKSQLNLPSTATTYATAFTDEAKRWTLGLFGLILGDEAFTPINHLTAIPDFEPVPSYCKELEGQLLKLYNAGILTGSDEWGTLYGGKPITRGAVATIVARILEPSQRKTLHLKEGRPSFTGVLDISTTQLAKTNAVLDQYENDPNVIYIGREIKGVIEFNTQSDSGAQWDLTIRRGNGWRIEGIDFGEGAKSQYEVIFALIDDVVEEPSRQQIKDMLTQYSQTLSKGYDPEIGATAEAIAYVKSLENTTVKIGNVNCSWSNGCSALTLSTASN